MLIMMKKWKNELKKKILNLIKEKKKVKVKFRNSKIMKKNIEKLLWHMLNALMLFMLKFKIY
jgi:hypothetical protein